MDAVNSTLDNHGRNSNGDSDSDDVDDTERLWVIIGFVLVLVALQVIGFFICCKDRWMAKRKAVKTTENPPSQAIEITEPLTSVRQPRKSRPVSQSDVERNNDSETGAALLKQNTQQSENGLEDPGESSVVQIHRTGEETGAEGPSNTTTQK
ncbi:hypothetical protein ILUMI_08430 [Ignelater luminosus]|uniref:Uncharacterized protein n=1 Tax=Ignelater luminosus TaxID=2038154 RepID=A0A8K0D1Y0_IGNLU|nr:hypothetical protein ILUMI_08430 [Ignelater luminosus]